MRIAILDPAAGISGDMTLGALLDAGAPRAWLEALPTRLGLSDVGVRIDRVTRGGVSATKVDFSIPGGPGHGRSVGELIALVRDADVSAGVRDRAVRAFELIGEAEGQVHGVRASEVHLHEVGAIDAVLDLVGGIEGFEQLGVERIYNLPVAVGRGWVEAAHGRLPVPAPATALLLTGVEVASDDGPVEGEATTPTGAALVRVLSAGAPPDRWRLAGAGWGAGSRDPTGYPNALRLLLGEAAAEAGRVEVVATDVDDFDPEYLEPLRAAVLAAGALDCVAWTTHGKKGRVSLRIEVLAPPAALAAVTDALFRHSSTAGVRHLGVTRITLPRKELAVELDGGARVRIKVWGGRRGERVKAEYDDVVAAALQLQRPPVMIAREAERLAVMKLRTDGTDITNEESA